MCIQKIHHFHAILLETWGSFVIYMTVCCLYRHNKNINHVLNREGYFDVTCILKNLQGISMNIFNDCCKYITFIARQESFKNCYKKVLHILCRAKQLWEQFQKKAELFQTNVVLVPHGDDFRYAHPTEWYTQMNNMESLMRYINARPHLQTEAWIHFSCFMALFVKLLRSIAIKIYIYTFDDKIILDYNF